LEKIISFTGTHGVGKTTRAFEMGAELKKNSPEKSVRVLTDIEADCPYPIGRGGVLKTQEWIFYNKMAREVDAMARVDLVVTDRTIMDVIAYTHCLGYQTAAIRMMAAAEEHFRNYKQIIFLSTLANPFQFNDGIRDMDPCFRLKVESILIKFYSNTGIRLDGHFISNHTVTIN